MRVARLTDYDVIQATIAHPAIYGKLADDLAVLAEEFTPVQSDALIYLGVYWADEFLGLFVFAPTNSVCYDVHTCLLPAAWGKAIEAGRLACQWMWRHTACRRIVTTVPVDNRLALRLALRCGFTQFGLNPQSWLKGGVMRDQILLGLDRPEVACL